MGAVQILVGGTLRPGDQSRHISTADKVLSRVSRLPSWPKKELARINSPASSPPEEDGGHTVLAFHDSAP